MQFIEIIFQRMPRSKREKEVSLTKVKKKTRATKEALVDEVGLLFIFQSNQNFVFHNII